MVAVQNDVRIKTGTKLMLDLETPVNSATTRISDVVWFKARDDVRVDGRVALPRGTPIRGSVIAVKPAVVNGKNQKTEIQIRLEEIPLESGGSLSISADNLKVEGERFGAGSAAQNALGQATQGAMLGASIGRSAKGAAIGAVAAVGAGILSAVLQGRGPTSDVDLPSGSVFEAKLQRPIDIPDPTMLAKNVPNVPFPTNASPAATSGTAATSVSISQPNSTAANEAPNPGVPTFDPLPVPESAPVTDGAPTPAVIDTPVEAGGRDVSEVVSSGTLKVDVNLVQVDAVVRDRSGRPMSNLRREDFRILEDGVEREIQFFSRDKLPLAVALVIDRSGSVAPLMNQVQNAAYQALQLLKAGDQVCLFAFAGNVELLEELTTNRQRVANRIGSIHAGGGTTIVDAVDEALRYLAATAPESRRAVILVSDNLEGNSSVSVQQAIELALETEASIYSVKIGNGGGFLGMPGIPGIPVPRLPIPGIGGGDPVPTLTKETGGEVFDATGGGSIPAALTAAIDRLKLRYTLGYPAGNSDRSAKGGYHRIQVQLVSRFGRPDVDYTVHARSGYYDPSAKRTGAVAQH
jgi:VWFA-related protein